MERLFRQFSFPGGIPSHVPPRPPARSTKAASSATSLSHAFGAAFDNPDLMVAVRRRRRRGRDRPARDELALEQVPRSRRATARCCRSCISTGTRSPIRPCSRASPSDELARALRRARVGAVLRRRRRPRDVHQRMAATLDHVRRRDPAHPDARARRRRRPTRPRWPMIVLRTPKGWTGPDDRRRRAGRRHVARASSAALRRSGTTRAPRACSRQWMRALSARRAVRRRRLLRSARSLRLAPEGARRMGANPHANGGMLLAISSCPTSATTRSTVDRSPARPQPKPTRVLGAFLRDVCGQRRRRTTSASSARTRPRRTGSTRCSR